MANLLLTDKPSNINPEVFHGKKKLTKHKKWTTFTLPQQQTLGLLLHNHLLLILEYAPNKNLHSVLITGTQLTVNVLNRSINRRQNYMTLLHRNKHM